MLLQTNKQTIVAEAQTIHPGRTSTHTRTRANTHKHTHIQPPIYHVQVQGIISACGAEAGDLLLLAAGPRPTVAHALDRVRCVCLCVCVHTCVHACACVCAYVLDSVTTAKIACVHDRVMFHIADKATASTQCWAEHVKSVASYLCTTVLTEAVILALTEAVITALT